MYDFIVSLHALIRVNQSISVKAIFRPILRRGKIFIHIIVLLDIFYNKKNLKHLQYINIEHCCWHSNALITAYHWN